jgi:type I restriction-modification system DNA methylase subunit
MRNEKVTDVLVLTLLRASNYIDGAFNAIDKSVQVWAKKTSNANINALLSIASKAGSGNPGYPEYIIYDSIKSIVVVIEDKRDTKYHIHKEMSLKVDKFAVNGALWYASKLKESFDVIAIGVSGNSIESLLIDTYIWRRGAETFSNLNIHEIRNIGVYRNITANDSRNVRNLDELSYLNGKAKEINEFLRNHLGVIEHKRLYVLGAILFALEDPSFKMAYPTFNNNGELAQYLYQTIERKTKNSGLKDPEIIQREIKPVLESLGVSEKEGSKDLYPNGTLLKLVVDIDTLLYGYYKNSEIDLISLFFNVFLSYSTSGGSDLGIVLTPSHITSLFSELANIDKKSKILDPCVGTGGFLTAAWKKVVLDKHNTFEEKEYFRKNNLFGVEKDPSIYTITSLNMFINKDGRSNLYNNDCFAIKDELKKLNCNVGFINPPYSDEVYPEISFVELMLDSLLPDSIGIAIISVNSVSSRTKKHARLIDIKRVILNRHTLVASIQMPNQLFYPKGVETIILVFRTHKKHSGSTWFAEYDDGYKLIKHQKTRTPTVSSNDLRKTLITAFKEKSETDFSFNTDITEKDQWVYTLLKKHNNYEITIEGLQDTVNNYVSYLFRNRYLVQNLKHNQVSIKANIPLKLIAITDFFDIVSPKQKDKMLTIESTVYDIDSLPFLGRKATNNGISGYIIRDPALINEGGVLTVALDGSTGATFYQHHSFASGQNIWILRPRKEKITRMTPVMALYFSESISRAVTAYSYNLSLTKSRLEKIKILLPVLNDGTVDEKTIISTMNQLKNIDLLSSIPNGRY